MKRLSNDYEDDLIKSLSNGKKEPDQESINKPLTLSQFDISVKCVQYLKNISE